MGNSTRSERGFTLIELLICSAIMAILATMAIPSFSEMHQNAVRRVALDNFWHAIFLARNEAIKRNSVVVLCKSATGVRCDNTSDNWSDGWIVFDNLDHDEPGQVDSGEPVLRIYQPMQKIVISSKNKQSFAFRSAAQGAVNGTIVFCDGRGSKVARAIIISHTGRPRQSQRDANNRPLTCTSS